MTTAPLVICRPRIGVDTGALSYVLRIMVPKVLARNSVIVQKEAHQGKASSSRRHEFSDSVFQHNQPHAITVHFVKIDTGVDMP